MRSATRSMVITLVTLAGASRSRALCSYSIVPVSFSMSSAEPVLAATSSTERSEATAAHSLPSAVSSAAAAAVISASAAIAAAARMNIFFMLMPPFRFFVII